jgi:hypothetical protein
MLAIFHPMTIAKLLVAATLVAAVPASAQRGYDPQAKLDRLLAGRVAGAPVRCIPLRPNTRSEIIEGQAIVYRDGRRLYVTRPTVGLNWLLRDSILVTRPVVSQLCAGEPVQLIDQPSRIQRGFVTLGDFVPYTRR